MWGRNRAAFTLIELMVVISVVAILSVVAAVSYKDYIAMSKLTQIGEDLENWTEQSYQYAEAHGGVMPNAYDLGLSTTPNSNIGDDDIVGPIIGPAYIANSGSLNFDPVGS